MIKKSLPLFLSFLGLALTVAGCASAGTGGDSKGETYFRGELGRVMVQPLLDAREKIWGKHTIPMYREERTSRSIYWETQWILRDPSPEEMVEGAYGARNRIIMQGTLVGENLDGTQVFRMRYEAENQVQTQLNPEWHPGIMPPVALEKYEKIYDDLMLELRTGIIR